VKRTYQPNNRRRAKRHGFRHRMSDRAGQAVLRARLGAGAACSQQDHTGGAEHALARKFRVGKGAKMLQSNFSEEGVNQKREGSAGRVAAPGKMHRETAVSDSNAAP